MITESKHNTGYDERGTYPNEKLAYTIYDNISVHGKKAVPYQVIRYTFFFINICSITTFVPAHFQPRREYWQITEIFADCRNWQFQSLGLYFKAKSRIVQPIIFVLSFLDSLSALPRQKVPTYPL